MNETAHEERIKALEEEIRVMKERYRILVETTPALLFEYQPEDDTMIFIYNFPDNKKRREIPRYKQFAKENPLVHPDHIQKFMDALREAGRVPTKGEIEYLSKVSTGEFQWHRTYYSSVTDEQGKVISILGRIHNIHEAATVKKEMQHRVETDSLTGLYNRQAISERVNRWLKANPESEACMLMLDIDNFKYINDMYGHSAGDKILKEIARLMQACFSEESILARFGGDEFVCFAMEPVNCIEDRVISFMNRLVTEITFLDVKVHCSIGIAEKVSEQDDFEDLFNRSDNAMYQAKNSGKNCYYICG